MAEALFKYGDVYVFVEGVLDSDEEGMVVTCSGKVVVHPNGGWECLECGGGYWIGCRYIDYRGDDESDSVRG